MFLNLVERQELNLLGRWGAVGPPPMIFQAAASVLDG